jgi:Alcohol dehydrogenase transcription factor Myb/SANT-like/Zinc-finger associated domain (zf-AD)
MANTVNLLFQTLAIRDHLAESIRLQSKPKNPNARLSSAGSSRCDGYRLKLIKMFKQQELLWNDQHRSHGSELLRDKAWRALAKDMGMSLETCQQLVQRIRASYEFKRRSLTSYQLAKGQPEWFYVAESFLRPNIQPPLPPSSPPKTPEPEVKCRDFVISVKKERVDDYMFANLYPELELPQVDEVKTETSEVITSKTTCRTCLTAFADDRLDELVSVDEEWNDHETFRQLYVELIGPTDSRLPSVVCSSCAEMLQRFFEFRTISQTNAKIYLETVSRIYSEHNYEQPEPAKSLVHDKEVEDEAGDDGEHEDTIVFVEPLPKLVKEENVIKVIPFAHLEEKKPLIVADAIDTSPVETERIFMDENEYVRIKIIKVRKNTSETQFFDKFGFFQTKILFMT